MSDRLFPGRDLDDATTEAADRIADAKREHKPAMTLLLLSGGNDSMVLLGWAAHEADAVLHVNTGIGIEETDEFVRDVCRDRKLRLIEASPPVAYDELVLGSWNGFPGNHLYAYAQLKDKAIRGALQRLRRTPSDWFLLLSGLRALRGTVVTRLRVWLRDETDGLVLLAAGMSALMLVALCVALVVAA